MKKLALLASLYVAQFIPVAFFMQTLPVFLRQQGVSLEAIGLTNLLSLPWTFKVIWSPIVDRYGWTKWGHYKSWILAMQSLLVMALVFCASLNIQTHFVLLLVGMLLAISCAATQDIATDALAVELLCASERGWGNSIQGAGGYFGGILGGGGILMLLDYWGWTGSLLAMALSILLLMIPVLLHRENSVSHKSQNLSWRELVRFFRRPGMGGWILVLLTYMMGTTIAHTMFRPLLVDLGLSLAQIGFMNGIVAYSAGLVGAIASGFLMKFLGGRKRSLIVFGTLMAIASVASIVPTLGFTSLPVLYLVSVGFQLAYSMALIPMYTVMMDYSRLGTAGFDYTLQVSIVFVGSLIAGGMSGFIAGAMGYRVAFIISGAIALLSVVIVAQVFHERTICDRGVD